MIESVLAGTQGFVAAISPAVKSRAGSEPRVAADPREAFTYCVAGGGLLVMEYAGPEWLPVVRDLRSLCGDAIAVVVAVGQERIAEIGGLQRAGADEVVQWDGRAAPVAWAIERILASRGGKAALEGHGPGPPAPPVPGRPPAPPAAEPTRRPPPRAGAPTPTVHAAAPQAAAPPPPLPAAAAPGAPVPAPVVTAGPPAPAPMPAAPGAFTIRELTPPTAPAPGSWPSAVLAGPEAEKLLEAVVTGLPTGPGPWREGAVQVSQSLSDLERRALAGVEVAVDAALVRRASGLRLRVALALGTAPAPGSPIDGAAVQSLLAEIDAALAELKTAAEGVGPEHHPGPGTLRSALLKEAIDLTDAVHRISPASAPAIPAPARHAARVLSIRAATAEDAAPPVRTGWMVVLVLAALAAAGFHGYRIVNKKPPVQPIPIAGAPEGTLGVRGNGVAVVAPVPGQPVDPKQMEAFRAQEAARGNVVMEVAPGTWVSVPATGEGKP